MCGVVLAELPGGAKVGDVMNGKKEVCVWCVLVTELLLDGFSWE